MIVPVARKAGIKRNIVKRHMGSGFHERRKFTSGNLERDLAFCGDDDRHILDIGRARCFTQRAVVTLKNDMCVGTAEAE